MQLTNETKGGIGLAVIVVIVIVWLILTSNSSNNTDGSLTGSTSSQSPAYELASADLGSAPNAATVSKYQAALDGLEPSCTEDETKLASEIWVSLKDLISNGITDETNLTLIGHIRQSIPASAGQVDCSGVMAAYLTLREPAQ